MSTLKSQMRYCLGNQADVESGKLTAGHAKALLQTANPERRRHLRDRILQEGLSVRAAEEVARPTTAGSGSKRRARSAQDPSLTRLADELRQRLQTRVRVNGNVERGRIEIEYFGSEDLERLGGLLRNDA